MGTTVARPPVCRDDTKVVYTRDGYLVCPDEVWRELEPNAPPVSLRIDALKKAHELGIRTWVSIEPLIPMYDADGNPVDWVTRFLFPRLRVDAKTVDWVVLGSLNYGRAWKEVSRVTRQEISGESLKRYYRSLIPNIINILSKYKVPYYLKKELLKHLPKNLKYENRVPVGGDTIVV